MIESTFGCPVRELLGSTDNVGRPLKNLPLEGVRLGRKLTVGDIVGGVTINVVFFVGITDLRKAPP